MTNPAIILKDGSEIPEGIMDAFIATFVLYTILKIKIIQELDQFILLNQKCMVLKKLHLLIDFLESRRSFRNIKNILLKLE